MKCRCVEIAHSHQGYCDSKITFEDSMPMNYDKDRCCNDCYDKIKNEAISALKIDKKVSKGCEVCGEHIDAVKRKDGINVCDRCNYKYP